MQKFVLVSASISIILATCLGAFGAHALQHHLDVNLMHVYQTAVQYQFYNSLGLLLVGVLMKQYLHKAMGYAGVILMIGLVLFSGSLYLLSLTGIRTIGIVTPIGGGFLIVGWVFVATAIYRSPVL